MIETAFNEGVFRSFGFGSQSMSKLESYRETDLVVDSSFGETWL
jgi:hypothetical protein